MRRPSSLCRRLFPGCAVRGDSGCVGRGFQHTGRALRALAFATPFDVPGPEPRLTHPGGRRPGRSSSVEPGRSPLRRAHGGLSVQICHRGERCIGRQAAVRSHRPRRACTRVEWRLSRPQTAKGASGMWRRQAAPGKRHHDPRERQAGRWRHVVDSRSGGTVLPSEFFDHDPDDHARPDDQQSARSSHHEPDRYRDADRDGDEHAGDEVVMPLDLVKDAEDPKERCGRRHQGNDRCGGHADEPQLSPEPCVLEHIERLTRALWRRPFLRTGLPGWTTSGGLTFDAGDGRRFMLGLRWWADHPAV